METHLHMLSGFKPEFLGWWWEAESVLLRVVGEAFLFDQFCLGPSKEIIIFARKFERERHSLVFVQSYLRVFLASLCVFLLLLLCLPFHVVHGPFGYLSEDAFCTIISSQEPYSVEPR